MDVASPRSSRRVAALYEARFDFFQRTDNRQPINLPVATDNRVSRWCKRTYPPTTMEKVRPDNREAQPTACGRNRQPHQIHQCLREEKSLTLLISIEDQRIRIIRILSVCGSATRNTGRRYLAARRAMHIARAKVARSPLALHERRISASATRCGDI